MVGANLADLDACAPVAAARSFRGAAYARGVSPSALSEAVRRLEDRLGQRLLHRTTRSVTPTDAGLRLLDRLQPALREVAEALAAVGGTGDAPTGTLRLNVPGVVAQHVLPPILSRFLLAHPGVTAEVVAQNSFVDVLASGFDAGVRYDERLQQDMIAVPLGPRVQRFVTAASPAYWDRHGRPSHPRELLDHRCILHRFVSGATPPWEFLRGEERVRVTPSGPLVANVAPIALSAALSGLGVVHTFEEYLAPHLAGGTLEPVLEEWSERFSGPFLYYAGRRHPPPPLRAFIAFLRSPAGAHTPEAARKRG